MTERFVYFIRPIGMEGPIKIGCSNSPPARLQSLMSWSPLPLEVVATVPGSFDLEFKVHECFLDLMQHREWFRADPRLTAAIERIAAGEPISQVLDFSKRTRRQSPQARKFAADPMARLRCSFSHRRSWAERRGENIPEDVYQILQNWSGYRWGNFHGPVLPTDEQLRRLEEALPQTDRERQRRRIAA